MTDDAPASLTLETIHGTITVTQPVIIELLQHPVMTRLKEIDQHGPSTYFGNKPTFSRYDHSVGVFALLRLHDCPLVEQVAGLLHDASHTVFSHLADRLFKTGNQHAYQDKIHEWYLQRMGIDTILKRYGMSIEEILPDLPVFTALEQKLPRLCADRIDGVLREALSLEKITLEQIKELHSALHFENGHWYFDTPAAARLFADCALYAQDMAVATIDNVVWEYWLCQALEQAIALGILDSDTLHFGTDTVVLEILEAATDPHIQNMLARCKQPHTFYRAARTKEQPHIHDMPKFRGVDPFIKLSDKRPLTKLTEHDAEYRGILENARQRSNQGIRVCWITP